jgi:H+-translocating NAD(P) transhydrogenase subunit alpha
MRYLGVVKEADLETRVALVPEVVLRLKKAQSAEIMVEKGAGIKAGYLDQDYVDAGATVVSSRAELMSRAEILLAINGLSLADEPGLANKTVIGLFDPYFNKDVIKKLCAIGVSLVSLELVPRISRAQSMDVLSSQANIAGYVAVLQAANKLNKVMPLMMTAAGTIKPAKILIVGAGVAGLQAIATAKRLGAMVFAYDVRSVVKEQVESLGAKFLEIKLDESGEGSGGYAKALSADAQAQQREKLALLAKDMDVVITTAQIPGRKAPLLLDDKVFSIMKTDSVIIDMASGSGGNVAGVVSNEWLQREGVWLYGADNLARVMPKDASFTFSKNIEALLELMGVTELNTSDEIMKDALICHQKLWINQAFSKSIQEG